MENHMSSVRVAEVSSGFGWWPRIHPLASVRRGILAGFALLVLILVAVVAGSAWLVREYQKDSAEMQQHAARASQLQQTEANASIAALLIQRYLLAGDETLVPEIRGGAAAAVSSLTEARAEAELAGADSEEIAKLDGFVTSLTALATGADQMIALRQGGRAQEAGAMMEAVVPVFRQFRLDLMAAADGELQRVSDLKNQAEETGDLAFTLLVVSGIVGIVMGIVVSALIARSVIKPLAALEATAQSVSEGDMSARAPIVGPRELARMGAAMNHMMRAVHERTEELRISNEELWARNQQLSKARAEAASDPLTGLLNHRKFHERIRELVLGAQENGTTVGLIMLDVDNFKQVNGSLGHQAGDQVLRDIATGLEDLADEGEAYRYGGDEFAILIPALGHAKTAEVADRLLGKLSSRTAGQEITVSLGVAAFPDTAGSAEELIYRADMALNWAKSAGKSQVGQWSEDIGRETGSGASDAVSTQA